MTRGDELREELKKDVALMRELGVVRWKAIFLGPAGPGPAQPEVQVSPEDALKLAKLNHYRALLNVDTIDDGTLEKLP